MTRTCRLTVLGVALATLVPKLILASRTFGTEDVLTWTKFAHGVSVAGPVGVYSIDFHHVAGTIYNHPPLMGYYLAAANQLARAGIPLGFTIRSVSSIADVFSALLVFEMVRRRWSLRKATAAAILVGISPVLFLVSGYHGNTDPLFVMLALLGAYLLVDRDAPLFAGVALALAVSVKVVPVVMLPALGVYALRHRRDLLARVAAGFGATFVVLWAWPLLSQPWAVMHHVIGYSGIADRQWGIVQLLSWTHNQQLVALSVSPGKTIVVAICALGPAALVWQRGDQAVEAACWSLTSFLLLSPAFGVQYLAWAAAPAFLLDVGVATAYNVLAGLFLLQVYNRWSGGFPWHAMARGRPFTSGEVAFGLVVWATLILLTVISALRFRLLLGRPASEATPLRRLRFAR
ncbi:MAG: hypothetical protein QOD87_1997 [Pseudonocardiales bacterium]|nr:hypothetical protein [Pseudonocardiales bacterium]